MSEWKTNSDEYMDGFYNAILNIQIATENHGRLTIGKEIEFIIPDRSTGKKFAIRCDNVVQVGKNAMGKDLMACYFNTKLKLEDAIYEGMEQVLAKYDITRTDIRLEIANMAADVIFKDLADVRKKQGCRD